MATDFIMRNGRAGTAPSVWARQAFCLCGLMLLMSSAFARAPGDQAQLDLATDLRATGQASANQQLVILVAATREDCSYCALLKREILLPMLKSGEYEQRILVRELVIEPETDVIDFDGSTVSSADWALKHSVKITPTVLLLDEAGKPLHPPLTGINTAEMYGFYLDRAIDRALARLRTSRATAMAQE
jgi:thioredoxin-related protein